MSDKVFQALLTFDGEVGSIDSVVRSIKGTVRSAVNEIQQTSAKLDLFGDIGRNLPAVQSALDRAKEKVKSFRTEIESIKASGALPIKALTDGLRDAERAAAAAEKEFTRQTQELAKLDAQLKLAGVDTSKLATEQTRLAASLKAATVAQTEQNAKTLLGVKTAADVKASIDKLNTAFLTLRESGKLSFGEIGTAQAKLQQQILALRREAGGVGQAFSDIRGRVLAFTAAFAGVTAGIASSTATFREFAQQVAAVDSIADSSKAAVDRLANGVRELAKALGVDVVQSTKALYEIISSGIPADSALLVLEQATKAAVAGMTDVDTAARVGVAVLNGYGLEVAELGRVYDVLFQTVKDGVITFPELAKSIGVVIPAARAAKIPLEELGAAFVVLTRQGFAAPEAATAINRAIVDLSAPAPAAAEKLRDLGIEIRGLVGTIEQLASRRLTLAQIGEIVPDERAARAVLALVSNFRLLRDEIGEMNKAAGVAQAAYLKLADTPQQQVARFNAALKDLSISIGELVHGSGDVVKSLTGMVNAFNALPKATKQTTIEIVGLAAAGAALVVVVKQLAIPLNLLVGALASIGATGGAAGALTATAAAVGTLQAALATFLGFKFGELLYENFAPVRVLGDILGTAAAAAVNFGEFALARLTAFLTGNKKAADEATAAYRRNAEVIRDQWTAAVRGSSERLRALEVEHQKLNGELAKTAAAAVDATSKLDAATSKIAASVQTELTGVEQVIATLQGRLGQLVASLSQNVDIVQSLGQAAITQINAQAAAQIAALDNLTNSQIALASKSLAIQNQAAADRLAVLQQESASVLEAFEAEAKARIDIAVRTGQNIKKVEQDVAAARRAILQQIVDANRANVNELIGQLTGYLNKAKEIEQARISFNEAAEAAILKIQRGSLTAYQQYQSKVAEIDALISKGRKALLAGDAQAAENYAKAAIAASGDIAAEVTDDGKAVVTAANAQATAIAAIQAAQKLANDAFKAQGAAAKDGAAKTKDALEVAQAELDQVQQKLDEVTASLRKGIEVSITANTKAVEATIEQLEAKMRQRDLLVVISADITLAQVEIGRLRSDLEQGITVNVKGRTDEIEEALKRVEEQRPELNLDVAKALEGVESVRAAVEKIEAVHVRIDTNVAETKKEIESLNDIKTSSTHTVHVVYDRQGGGGDNPVIPPVGLARGGPVPRWSISHGSGDAARPFMVQRYAGGGLVFPRPTWSKVPGPAGAGDIVPASLQRGSFVVRRAASSLYGDAAMAALAGVKRFATGGTATDSFADRVAARLEAIAQRHAAVNAAVKAISPLIDASKGLPRVSNGQNIGDALSLLLEKIFAATSVEEVQALFEPIAADLSRIAATIQNAVRQHAAVVVGAMAPSEQGGASRSDPVSAAFQRLRFLAQGGDVGTDTVPALLSPGEWVLPRRAVEAIGRFFGGGFLPALNSMRIAPGFFDSMIPAAPSVAHFAAGGPVGQVAPAATFSAGVRGGETHYHMHFGDVKGDPKQFVNRIVIPELTRHERRKAK